MVNFRKENFQYQNISLLISLRSLIYGYISYIKVITKKAKEIAPRTINPAPRTPVTPQTVVIFLH